MRRSAETILTTHTGSLPRPAKVVELLLAGKEKPGANRAALDAAVRAPSPVWWGSRSRPASTSSMTASRAAPITPCMSRPPDRLRGQADAAARHRRAGISRSFAQLLNQFASPFQHRPACSGPVTWKDLPAVEADIARAKAAMTEGRRQGIFHDVAVARPDRALSQEQLLQDRRGIIFALADVMAREYRAIVDAGFILQLDCPDLAMSYGLLSGHQHRGLPQVHLAECRGAQSRGEGPAARPDAHARLLGLDARAAPRRHRDQGHFP